MDPLRFAQTPLGVAVVLLLCTAGSYVVMQLRAKVESDKKEWLDVAQKLASIGLSHLATILQCLAVGDLSGALREAKALRDILKDPKQRAAALKEAGKNILSDLYQDPNYRTEIDQFLQDLRDKHLPDRSSVFASTVDEVANHQTMLDKIKADLANAQARLQQGFSNATQTIQKTAATAAPIVAAALPPAAPAALAAGAVAAGSAVADPAKQAA